MPALRTEGFLAPSWYQKSPDGAWYALGTDYLGRPFVPVLCQATSATLRIALLGTAAVVVGCLIVVAAIAYVLGENKVQTADAGLFPPATTGERIPFSPVPR